MVSRPNLDLLTIALKTGSNKPMHREFCKIQKVLDCTEILLHREALGPFQWETYREKNLIVKKHRGQVYTLDK
ncbi:MAG: hypothetical protein DRG66_04700 [Deltaproteobacteria bacterium]|nr:MAG: hypothetical protein DRG66_04700 [Deltaproteobacteria bacterium]